MKTSFSMEAKKNGGYKFAMQQGKDKTPLFETNEKQRKGEALRRLAMHILVEAGKFEFLEENRTIENQIFLMKYEHENQTSSSGN